MIVTSCYRGLSGEVVVVMDYIHQSGISSEVAMVMDYIHQSGLSGEVATVMTTFTSLSSLVRLP